MGLEEDHDVFDGALFFPGFDDALYALSLFVVGLTAMRLITGTFLRGVDGMKILFVSFGLILAGLILLKTSISLPFAIVALILLGAGLAGGFPILLGIVGSRYSDLSGTAFSFVLVIALVGNILINYVTGFVAQHFGVQQVVNIALVELAAMIVLSLYIRKMTFNKIK